MVVSKGKALATEITLRVIMFLLCVLIVFPFLYCVAYSLSDSVAVATRQITFYPIGLTFKNYKDVFMQRNIVNSFFISVARTVLGAVYTVTVTGLAAYAISKKTLPWRRALSIFMLIPMYISGGTIPNYVLMFKIGLYNSFWVYILPHGIWAFNMLLMRTYFDGLPAELEEAAHLDGAGDLRIFWRIILPLSMPIVSVIAMYSGVWQWNSWYDAQGYITKSNLKPLAAVLQQMIMSSYSSQMSLASGGQVVEQSSPEAIRMATLVITTVPIVIVYPFFQKYFVQGVLIGAVKA